MPGNCNVPKVKSLDPSQLKTNSRKSQADISLLCKQLTDKAIKMAAKEEPGSLHSTYAINYTMDSYRYHKCNTVPNNKQMEMINFMDLLF